MSQTSYRNKIQLNHLLVSDRPIQQIMHELADRAKESGLFPTFDFNQFYSLQGYDPRKHANVLLGALCEYAEEHGIVIE